MDHSCRYISTHSVKIPVEIDFMIFIINSFLDIYEIMHTNWEVSFRRLPILLERGSDWARLAIRKTARRLHLSVL